MEHSEEWGWLCGTNLIADGMAAGIRACVARCRLSLYGLSRFVVVQMEESNPNFNMGAWMPGVLCEASKKAVVVHKLKGRDVPQPHGTDISPNNCE